MHFCRQGRHKNVIFSGFFFLLIQKRDPSVYPMNECSMAAEYSTMDCLTSYPVLQSAAGITIPAPPLMPSLSPIGQKLSQVRAPVILSSISEDNRSRSSIAALRLKARQHEAVVGDRL